MEDAIRWARTSVTVNLRDARSGKIFGRLEASERAASADYDEAVRRSAVAAAKKIADQIHRAINGYLESI